MNHIKTMLPAAAAAAALLLGAAGQAFAQSRVLGDRLEAATRLECSFSTLATGDWGDDSTTVTATEITFETAFFDVNVDEGTAEADGRFGASYIVVRYANGYLHFMQALHAGPLYVTTIVARESSPGRLLAVHTRHEYSPTVLPGFTSRPEMYVGDCAIANDG